LEKHWRILSKTNQIFARIIDPTVNSRSLKLAEKIRDVQSPRGLARLAWRAPIWFYRLGLGGLFGQRMLLLEHIGRKSGQVRQNVLEVVRHDEKSNAYVVASGFGEQADWYKNVTAHPQVTIQVGNNHMTAHAERLPVEEATDEMLDYNRRHPVALRTLSGKPGSDAPERIARKMPMVAFRLQK